MSKPMDHRPIFDDAFWAKVIAAGALVGEKTFAFGGRVWVQKSSSESKQ